MIDDINKALQAYQSAWDKLEGKPTIGKPNAVGWKVADAVAYADVYQQLRPSCDKIVETWMNGRWIAKMHLKDTQLDNGTLIIKLMQRRPGSNDAVGLDHVDYICADMTQAEAELTNGSLKWTWESNDIVDNYRWLSIWFDCYEAKVKDYGVVDIVIRELQEMEQ